MNFQLNILRYGLFSIFMIVVMTFLPINYTITHYASAQTSDTMYKCENIGGRWDPEHKVCFNIYESEQCSNMGGSLVTGVGREYVCPLDNPDCGGYMGAPTACIFPDSIKTETKIKAANAEKNPTVSSENISEDNNAKDDSAILDHNNTMMMYSIVLSVCAIGTIVGIFYIKSRKK